MQPFTYQPPKQLQDMRIWSLVIANIRQGKVSEYNYSSKSPFALNTWPDALNKLNNSHNGKYAKVVGLVSDKILTIDVDNQPDLPQNCKDLIKNHPTHHHRSKSGKGWKIYYLINEPLPKKMIKHPSGELFCNMFVTTTDPDLTDFTDKTISAVTREEIAKFIPEANKQLKERQVTTNRSKSSTTHIDLDKVLNEVQRMLAIIPVDIDSILEIAYDSRFTDFELNSYTHWLLVSHALSDLTVQLSDEYPNAWSKVQILFHDWSLKGASYKSEQECNDRFERSLDETVLASGPIISFSSLRKLFWAYRIPISDFPVIRIVGKEKVKVVDPTDPENYEFLTKVLNIKLFQEVSRGHHYIKGPPATVKHYFNDSQFYFLTDEAKDVSLPFSAKIKADDNLIFRLVKLFRHFGIKGALRNHPIFAGFNKEGIKPLDTLYEWISVKPWDKTPRIESIIKHSITIDDSMIPYNIPKQFYHSLILKHLTHMAGLRAKAYRIMINQQKPSDRFKKAQGVLILAGYQNTRKSTWIECLLPSQANYVSNITPSSAKDTLEIQRALAGTFILNIDEIDAVFDTLNISDFKNMITQDKDSFRTMYTQTFDDYPRAAGLFGTTNKQKLKLDRTGNRRFWIIPIKECNAEPFNRCDYQQVWAELLYYAENLNVDQWNTSGQDKKSINETAEQYMKQTISGKTLDMVFSDDDGESLLYDQTEFDFDFLFDNFPQRLQRRFTVEKLFFPVFGNKCFVHLQNMFIMDDNIEFKLSSFNYEITSFLDNLLGFQNETRTYEKLTYKAGVVTYRTGKVKPTLYHFIPYKEALLRLIDEGEIPPEVLIR